MPKSAKINSFCRIINAVQSSCTTTYIKIVVQSNMTESDSEVRRQWSPTREEYSQLWKDSRLSIPPLIRIPAAALTAFGVGMTLGLAQGSKMAGLRFRAEHAHRLPTTTTGWYLYHKSKNYHLAYGGLKEGFKVGVRLSVLSTSMFCAENLFDVYRGTKDLFSTVMASLAVAGGFSFWSMAFSFLFSLLIRSL